MQDKFPRHDGRFSVAHRWVRIRLSCFCGAEVSPRTGVRVCNGFTFCAEATRGRSKEDAVYLSWVNVQ